MAYNKNRWSNYRTKAGGFARKAGGYARRGAYRAGGYARKAGGYAKRYQTAANRGFGPEGFKVYPDMPLAAGIALGVTNVDQMIPGEVILLGAALPIGGKYGRSARNFFGGIILGELLSRITGFKLNIPDAKIANKASVASIYA